MATPAATPKWPGDHADKHRQAALLGWARRRGFSRDTVKRGRRKPEAEKPLTGIRRANAELEARRHGARTTAQDYLQEPVSFGGEYMTRGQMIQELRKRGGTPRQIDRYLQGYELGKRLGLHQPVVRGQRPPKVAQAGYTPHAQSVMQVTLMRELGLEQDKAKRAAIRRQLRKLGVPSDQIPKEPRKPRAERTAPVERKPRSDAGYEAWKARYEKAGEDIRNAITVNQRQDALTRHMGMAAQNSRYFKRYVREHPEALGGHA